MCHYYREGGQNRAPASYKWSYNLHKWRYTWVTGVLTLRIACIARLYITPRIPGRNPSCTLVLPFFLGGGVESTCPHKKNHPRRTFHYPTLNVQAATFDFRSYVVAMFLNQALTSSGKKRWAPGPIFRLSGPQPRCPAFHCRCRRPKAVELYKSHQDKIS